MAKNWIKKAIKHPGRCTPGSPNYDCPKGSPQWNLAQRFKHGDLHKKEDGGYATSDNIDIGYYTNPVKYFAENGINLDESFSNRYVLSIQEFKNVVPDYQYEGYINSGIEGKYKNIDKTKYPVLVDKLQDGTITYRPYTIENAEKRDTTFNEVQKFSNGGYISTQDYANMQKVQAEQSVNNFNQFLQNNELGYDNPQVDLQGNPIQQKRSNPFEFQERKFESIGAPGSAGDKIQKAFSVMQAGSDAILKSVNPGQMASMMGKGLGDIGKGLEKMTPDLQEMQNIVPQSENYMEGLTNSNKYLDYDASNAKIRLKNMKARIAGSSNPTNAILGGVNMAGGTNPMSMISTAGSATSQALAATTKDDTKFGAAMQGGENARAISNTFTKNLDMLGPAGTAAKMGINGMSWLIGAIVNARKLAIQKEEEGKREKNQEYQNRNMQAVTSPYARGVGNYKNGGSIKNLEQRLIDDIFSDYDKFMKLT